mmetsp:Transcript_997/g.1666  ORF Transcript_997/g.1666 Transcript_997/m.1666 type:complete len:167 (+) Transcript_997:289-789(+)
MSDDSTSSVLRLVQSLAPSVAYKESNLEQNRKVWNLYAKDWKPDEGWVRTMAENLGEEWRSEPLAILGDEWSDRESVLQVIKEFILPHLPEGANAAEIGVGGGRIATKVAPRCGQLHCLDISAEMLSKAKQALSEVEGPAKVQFHLLESNTLPESLGARLLVANNP